jgi:hypothetical protein
MGLGDLYQQDVDAGLGAMAQRPLPPAPKEERSAWGAPWRAVKSAAAEVIGSTADVLGAYGQVMAGTDAPLGSPEHQKLRAGADLSSETGDLFRGVAHDLRPDPMTASTAEQVVYGVVRPLAKLVGGGALLGPFGLAGAAAEEGFTQADELRQEGVDLGTRSKVGALTAAATFGGAALPLAGSTLGRTAALYLAGGPGGFMAQQAATRAILERADYASIAQQYDPLDPMGLAISALIPLPFAAHGAMRVMRGRGAEAPPVRIEPTMVDESRNLHTNAVDETAVLHEPAFSDTQPAVHVPNEVVDAAMVHNLSRLQDAHEAVAAEGTVRYYHGGAPEGVDGPLWFTSELRDAQGWAGRGDGMGIWYVDVPASHPARGGEPEFGVLPPSRVEFPPEIARQRQVLQEPARPPAVEAAPPKPAAPSEGNPLDAATLTRTEPAAPKDRTPEHVASVTERAAQIEAEKPDTVVRHDDAGKPVTAAEEMARIRQEIAEGTDIDLGTLDADLVRVAAACALSTGA